MKYVLGSLAGIIIFVVFFFVDMFGLWEGGSLSAALASAGPGQYEVSTVFDGVNQAKSFGASHRAYDSVRFPGGDKQFLCTASPGPGASRPFQNDAVQMWCFLVFRSIEEPENMFHNFRSILVS